ncbi:MAG: glycosyltransferase [Solobacterium sp.]|nr:glycosyltransferase [Solobacterium sp.]
MKILFVTTLDLQIQTFHEKTIRELAKMGHIVDAASSGPYTFESLHRKITVPFHRNPLHPANLKAVAILRKLIREEGYDIVSCHSPSGGFYGRLAARGLPVRVLYTAHGFHFWKGSPLLNQAAFKNMERLAAHWTDVLMTINPEDYEAAKTFVYKPGGYPVYIPGVGVDTAFIRSLRCDRKEVLDEFGIPESAFVLYSIGELIPRKNHIFVLNALKESFQSDPQLHYVIAGGGENEALNAFIRDNHLEGKIHLAGFRKDARRLMYGADLFVFPSLQEGLPVAVMEAMAAGAAILASDIRGNHDLIQDGKNGMLYESQNTAEFLAKFQELRESEALRNRLAGQALRDSLQYSEEVIRPQILALYQ